MAHKITGSVTDEERLSALNAILRKAEEQSEGHKEVVQQTKRFPDKIITSIESRTSLDRTISDWRPILSKECQVYVYGTQYVAKRFDQVHYKYTDVDEAKEILIDNLFAILMYKYFPQITDEVFARIDAIVKTLTKNLKTFLTKIVFDDETTNTFGGVKMKRVPISCVAFSNGIYDFAKNDWVVKYDRIYIPNINNTIILYNDYIVNWNFDFDFDPLPISITEMSFEDFIEMMKELDKEDRNYCFELFWNMTHDANHKTNLQRMIHLAQVMGYMIVPQFLQYFVMLIGSGQNGKNSLFDGCFSCKVIPRPASNSIEEIETDRFVTGTLESASHNIFLETSAKVYTDSNMLKALTGSMQQTIQNKGVNKYSGIINCKYLFAGNDQSKIKFSDTTTGFRRRINIFEVYYSWDAQHRFMRYGDYYATDFSGDLHEIKQDVTNTVCYIYLAMYGVMLATKGFTSDFKFSYNEWTDMYSDIDFGLKEFFNDIIKVEDYFVNLGDVTFLDADHLRVAFFDEKGDKRLYNTRELGERGIIDFQKFVKFANETTSITSVNSEGEEFTYEESSIKLYLQSHDIFISLPYLRALMTKYTFTSRSQREFNDMFKKVFPTAKYLTCARKEPYVKARMFNGRIRFVDG